MSMNTSSSVRKPSFTDFNTHAQYVAKKQSNKPTSASAVISVVTVMCGVAIFAGVPFWSEMLIPGAILGSGLLTRASMTHTVKLLKNRSLKKKMNSDNQRRISLWLDSEGVSLTRKEAAYVSRMTVMNRIENQKTRNNFFVSMVNDAGTQDMILQKNGPHALSLYVVKSDDSLEESPATSTPALVAMTKELAESHAESRAEQNHRMMTVSDNLAKNFPDVNFWRDNPAAFAPREMMDPIFFIQEEQEEDSYELVDGLPPYVMVAEEV